METTFTLQRTIEDRNSTAGLWCDPKWNIMVCTLERGRLMSDGHPRIPAGRYPLRWKEDGWSKFDARYKARFPRWYTHMIEICDVPHRSEILIHTANRYTDLLGCVGVGTARPGIRETPRGYEIPPGTSMPAFSILYPALYKAITAGKTWLVVNDVGVG